LTRHPAIADLLAEEASIGADLQLRVTTVNDGAKGKGPKGNWTPERLAELGKLQARFADVQRAIHQHPDFGALKSMAGRIVGAAR